MKMSADVTTGQEVVLADPVTVKANNPRKIIAGKLSKASILGYQLAVTWTEF